MKCLIFFGLLICSLERPAEELELERYLREISLSSDKNPIPPKSNEQNKIDGKMIDTEADSFIQNLKKLVDTKLPQPSEINDSLKIDVKDKLNRANIDTSKFRDLQSSSFRVKILLLKHWKPQYSYPNNVDYADLEKKIIDTINKAYQNYADFIIIHPISFNFLETLSFYTDFIITFKNNGTHLGPLLKIIADGAIQDVPISPEKIYIYALNDTDSGDDRCDVECTTTKCASHCPETCCKASHDSKKLENIEKDHIKENDNTTESKPTLFGQGFLPLNMSVIQNEILKIFERFTLKTMKEPERNETEISQNNTPIVSDSPTSSLPSLLENSITSAPISNSWGYQNHGNNNPMENAPIAPEYSEYWPASNKFADYSYYPEDSISLENTKRNNVPFGKPYFYPMSPVANNPNKYIKTPNPFQFVPSSGPLIENRMKIESANTNNYGGKLKIWYPKL